MRIGLAAAVIATVAVSASFLLDPGTTETPPSFIAPARSPIEVEYPEYPGAPQLQTAAVATPAATAQRPEADAIRATSPRPQRLP